MNGAISASFYGKPKEEDFSSFCQRSSEFEEGEEEKEEQEEKRDKDEDGGFALLREGEEEEKRGTRNGNQSLKGMKWSAIPLPCFSLPA